MGSFTITQNTSFLTAASILQKVISFFYFTIIARVIGVENTGVYFFAITFTTIFTVVADFGMGPVLTREVARYPEKTDQYLHTAFWSKMMFGVASYILILFFVNIFNYESIGVVFSQAITLIVGTLALYNHWHLYWLILAYTIPAFLNFIFSAYFLRKVYNLVYHWSFDYGVFKMFLSFAIPYALD